MSGGSFDYLYCKDLWQLLGNNEQLQEMAETLRRMQFLDIAGETEVIIKDIEKFEKHIVQKIESLSKIWKAVEWFVSNDSGIEPIKEAIREFRLARQNGQ